MTYVGYKTNKTIKYKITKLKFHQTELVGTQLFKRCITKPNKNKTYKFTALSSIIK